MTSRISTTHWTGGLSTGNGRVSLDSSGTGEFDVTWPRRIGEPEGTTSPEELIAAAHSACMAMNLSGTLGKAGFEPEYLDIRSEVTAGNPSGGGLAITGIALTVRAKVPGVDPEQFAELAVTAEATCPVSKALAGTTITMDAALV